MGAVLRLNIFHSLLNQDRADDRGSPVVDVIELPQRDQPLCLAACPSTGNLIVGAANLLVVYKYCTSKTREQSKTRYIDFEERFHVFHNFVPTEVRLVEDVVACLSPTDVHIFKVRINEEF